MHDSDQPEVGLLSDPLIQLAVLFAATVAFFLPTLLSYHELWIAQPYTHGYLIAAATLWMLWRERGSLSRSGGAWWLPLPIAASFSLLWALGAVADVRVAMQTAVPLLLLCWSAIVFGPRVSVRLAPIAGVFLLAVPFWSVFVPPLRLLTVTVCSSVLGLVGVPVLIEGSSIHIPSGTFLIEDACAGFNYFMAGLAVGAIYAMTFLRWWPARVVLIAIATTLAIVGNWVRVASLIVIGHVTEMEAAVIYDHGTFGWGVFFVGLILLLPASALVSKWESRRRPRAAGDAAGLGPAASASAAGMPIDTSPGNGGLLMATTTRPALLASAIVVLGPALYLSIGALPSTDVDTPPLGPPTGWYGADASDHPAYAWSPAYTGADVHEVRRWSNAGAVIQVDRLVYHDQAQGAELIGYLSRIAPAPLVVSERMFGPVGSRWRIVNEAIIREGSGHLLVWYWYTIAGIETASPLKAKLLEVLAFFRRRGPSDLTAVSAMCDADTCAEAAELLLSFIDPE